MCLPVTPYKVEREWQYKGLSCAVVLAREAGHRCGYVRVPPGHPFHGKHYDTLDVDVHGGLTFAELETCAAHADGQGYWFGFDCAHYMDVFYNPDAKPEEARSTLEIHRKYSISPNHGHYWTLPEVVAETERLAEQLQQEER